MMYHDHPIYDRRPESISAVEAIPFTDDESGEKIRRWIEAIQGRGAALYDNGVLFLLAEDFGTVIPVPLGWVVYRKCFDSRFRVLPAGVFDVRFGVRA